MFFVFPSGLSKWRPRGWFWCQRPRSAPVHLMQDSSELTWHTDQFPERGRFRRFKSTSNRNPEPTAIPRFGFGVLCFWPGANNGAGYSKANVKLCNHGRLKRPIARSPGSATRTFQEIQGAYEELAAALEGKAGASRQSAAVQIRRAK